MKTREQALRAMEGHSFDVCVIGGGATGSGCALDSQLRGLKTVQLEAYDFAGGASSASTKMVHGGVRYLQEAIRRLDFKEYRVLKEALHERIRMLRNAPYLTNTSSFVTPCFGWLDAAYFAIGLKLYDWIAGRDGLAPSIFISRQELLRRIPRLASKGLIGAVVYSDGQFDDARYNIALVKTFAEAGGEPLNYSRVVALEKDGSGKLASAIVEEQMTHRKFAVHARCFVNATGPRADTLRRLANPDLPPRVRFSKGVHLILPLETLGGREALLIPKTEDGRVLFAIPWLGCLLVGTTDDEIDSLDDVHLQAHEVNYLLRHLNRFLADPVTADKILSGMAGVRPLLTSRKTKDTRKLARDHEVEVDDQSGLISIMGGKWTTYRAMAQNTIDAVQKYLGVAVSECPTLEHPLVGSEGYSPDYWKTVAARFDLPEKTARKLVERFGTRAPEVMELVKDDPAPSRLLAQGEARLCAEVLFAIRNEMAITIEDILARRIGLQTHSWSNAIKAAPTVANLLARELGWSDIAKQEALAQYVTNIAALMRAAGIADHMSG